MIRSLRNVYIPSKKKKKFKDSRDNPKTDFTNWLMNH